MDWKLALVVVPVSDVAVARAELVGRGVEVSEMFHFDAGVQTPGPDPQRSDYGAFLSFTDPDGNGWLVQDVGRIAPERETFRIPVAGNQSGVAFSRRRHSMATEGGAGE